MLDLGVEEAMAFMASVARPTDTALLSLHYAYPATVFAYYLVTSTVAICTLQTKSSETKHILRRTVMSVLFFGVLTYFCQLLAIVLHFLLREHASADQDCVISLLSCILVFGLQFAWLCDSEKPVWYPYLGSIGIALVIEPVIETLYVLTRSPGGWNYLHILDISVVAARWLGLAIGMTVYLAGKLSCRRERGTDAERQGLLRRGSHGHSQTSDNTEVGDQDSYGSTTAVSDSSSSSTKTSQTPVTDATVTENTATETTATETAATEPAATETTATETTESPWERRQRQAAEQMEKRLKENGNWLAYAKSFLIFVPYIWPVHRKSLQLRVVLVGLCLLAMNFVNLMIPRQLGIIIDSLNGKNHENPWMQVLFYAGLRLIASESGLSLLREWLWIPVENYSSDAMSTAAYSHVLNLSCDFHDSKSSSDIMVAIQSGQSVTNMLDSICFRAIPMLIDMCVAYIYLSVTFGPYEGFITIATACVFFYMTSRMFSGIKDARRSEVNAYFQEHYVRQAGIQGWTTVTYFNQVAHEETRYSTAIKNRLAKNKSLYVRYLVVFAFQHIVLLSGLLAGAFLAVYQVTHEQITSGQFMSLLTYWAQLVAPLNFFASLGKNISRDLIGAEQLLDIMQTKPSVVNKEGAGPLNLTGGLVQFKNVWFSYDSKKEILKDIDFTAAPGTTTAFVGATGAGKSTILKLLDRFYDVTSGSIKIDGQDIRDVDIYSLRVQIGVVPQSPMLFDDTIINNVRYARLDATDEEIYAACEAACIHEQILGFSEGYNTRVGERGVKLSGGELQRIAIARAILKRPSLVLLDEATSAVDTETEQKIQEALRTLCKKRTTLVVAHRLSTIMNADRIIVIGNGEIIEAGTHDELIRANGKYAELWSKQVFVQKPAPKTPENGESAEENAKKQAPTILNDLTPEATSTELAKVSSSQASQASSSTVDDSTESDSPTKSTPGHKKEGSKLNPDAPTFTPRSLAKHLAAAMTENPAGPDRSADGHFDSPTPRPRVQQPIQHVQWAPVFMYPAPFSLCPHPPLPSLAMTQVAGDQTSAREPQARPDQPTSASPPTRHHDEEQQETERQQL